jgi:restriction system protein
LAVDDFLDLETLKVEPEIPPFQPGPLAHEESPPVLYTFLPPVAGGLGKLVPGAKRKHEQAVATATEHYNAEVAARELRERDRRQALEAAQREHQELAAKITARADQQNAEVDMFRAHVEAGDPEALVQYFSLVLDRSHYPQDFPRSYRAAFVPESKQLVVEYEMPTIGVVPDLKQYRYVKARDAIDSSPRPVPRSCRS